jgi:DNA-directed RNA polymerase specialized sigma24 family protein
MDAAWDLRRKRRREVVDRIVEGSVWLTPADRALVLAYYRDGQRATEIARLANEPVRALRRRLRRAVRRVLSPEFAFVVEAHAGWSPTRRRVARACVLEGWSQRETSERLGLSLHTVRRHHDAVRGMFELRATSP